MVTNQNGSLRHPGQRECRFRFMPQISKEESGIEFSRIFAEKTIPLLAVGVRKTSFSCNRNTFLSSFFCAPLYKLLDSERTNILVQIIGMELKSTQNLDGITFYTGLDQPIFQQGEKHVSSFSRRFPSNAPTKFP